MVTPEEMIHNACAAIGDVDPDSDWKIIPTEHAALFADKAASLKNALLGSKVQGSARAFEEFNAKAIEARDNFKRTVNRANTAIFCAASFGALLLVACGLQSLLLGASGRLVIGVIGLLGTVSGSLATMWLNQVKASRLLKNWTKDRAKAEAKRLAYFKAVMDGVSEAPFDQLLAFEYTRRFLLDNQIAYYHERGDQHERANDRAVKTSTQATFASKILTAIAGVLSIVSPRLSVIAGLRVIASAYSTLSSSRSTSSMDRRNADRYQLARDHLEERRLELDTYRKNIASGDIGATQKFFEPIFVTLATEHKEFLDHSDLIEMAIGNMKDHLKSVTEGLNMAKIEATLTK